MSVDDIGALSEALASLCDDHRSLAAPVPSCAGWSLADLCWHLTDVQNFWTWVVDHRPSDPAEISGQSRPADPQLASSLRTATARLCASLDGADPADPAWSWSDDHTVGFTVRRQTHEALIHSIDGHLALSQQLPAVAPQLAADGVDELLSVMLSGTPPWAAFARTGGVVELRADDTNDHWLAGFGEMTGRAPGSDADLVLPALELLTIAAEGPDTVIAGSALDLDLWMWGRCDQSTLTISGDEQLAIDLRSLVVDATQ